MDISAQSFILDSPTSDSDLALFMNIRNIIIVVVLFLVVGCAARPPYEELVVEAEQTGDWSAVKQYERMNKSMNRIDGETKCNNGYIFVCHTEGDREECGCVSPLDQGLRQ